MRMTITRNVCPCGGDHRRKLEQSRFMLWSHHSPFRKAVHGWSCYESREKGDICVGDRHSYAVRRGGAVIGKCYRRGYGVDVVHGGASESLDLRLGAGRVPTAMNDGITNALIGGIGQNRIGVHKPT